MLSRPLNRAFALVERLAVRPDRMALKTGRWGRAIVPTEKDAIATKALIANRAGLVGVQRFAQTGELIFD